jgi:hypothetical protein
MSLFKIPILKGKLQSLFYQIIKNSFVSAILLFAAGYFIVSYFKVYVLEELPPLFYPSKTLLVFLVYIFVWLVSCYIRAIIALKKQNLRNN